jgi:Tol biopolymer transport system component
LLRLSATLAALVIGALLLGKTLPAGDFFSFADTRGFNIEIYALDAARSLQVNLTRSPIIDFQEAWSPDGTRMAFLSNRHEKLQLYLMTLGSGGGVRLLDAQEVSPNYRPVWSPDGKALVYEAIVNFSSDIAVVNVDPPLVAGSNPRILVPSLTADRYPVWSPDGKQIAFTSWRTGDAEIFLVSVDGSSLTELTNSPGDDASPSWSPDGQQIAFLSQRSQYRELYVMKRDGSDVRQLSNARNISDGDYWGAPLWSADGQAIAYQAVSGTQPSIVIVGLGGSVKRRLINAPPITALFSGAQIAYRAIHSTRALLYLSDPDGGNPFPLTPINADANMYSTLFAR